jgi:hypothetical protein
MASVVGEHSPVTDFLFETFLAGRVPAYFRKT